MKAAPALLAGEQLPAVLLRSAGTGAVVATAGVLFLLGGLVLVLRTDQRVNQAVGVAEATASAALPDGSPAVPRPLGQAPFRLRATGTGATVPRD